MKRTDILGVPMFRALSLEEVNRGATRDERVVRVSEVRSIDEDARTVELAFSSEEPVSRWFGDEVLSHDADAVDLSRLENSAPLLVNHDTDDIVGVVQTASIDADRRGRAVVRFGQSARAEEVFRDVIDGIRVHVSVGYRISAFSEEEREGQSNLITATRWMPFEVSLASVPADASVGVGRGFEPGGEPPEADSGARRDSGSHEHDESPGGNGGLGPMEERILRDGNGNLVRARVDGDGNIVEVLETLETAQATRAFAGAEGEAERQRASDLLSLGASYDAMEQARAAVDNGTSVAEFTRSLLDVVNGRGGGNDGGDGEGQRGGNGGGSALSDRPGEIGLTERELDQYSFLNVVRMLASPNDARAREAAAFEIECSRAAEQEYGRAAQGVLIPLEVLQHPMAMAGSRTVNTGGVVGAGDTGGNLVANRLSASFIDLLRNRSILLSMGTPLGGLVGTMDIPGDASGTNAYWIDEDDEAGKTVPESRLISLAPKTLAAFSEMTRKMLRQGSRDMELWLRRHLASGMGTKVDDTGFYGAGTATEPLGLKNIAGINAVPFAAVQPTFEELVQMETEVSSDNADVMSMAYIGNAAFRGHAKTTEKFAGSNGATIWEPGGTVNGYRSEITNQVVTGDVFHGNFADMLVASWGGLDVIVDPYTESRRGRLRVTMFQDYDFAHQHVESFCFGQKPPV